MKFNPIMASIFSTLVPGLGQMLTGHSVRGAAILIAVIVVGNLNAIWLSAFALSTGMTDSHEFWSSVLPRVLHDLFAAYGVIFLVWQIVDAYLLAKNLDIERNDSL
jgi:TM2 domain-containing membrane protein YozV